MKRTFTLLISILCIASVYAQSPKTIVLEEGTGTWCPWCTGGTAMIEILQDANPALIAIAVHQGDPMMDDEYIMGSAFSSYPSGHIMRKRRDLAIDEWQLQASLEGISRAPATVDVSTSYDESSRNLEVTITANCTQNTSKEYRLSAIVVEDGVFGRNSDYSQRNAYAGTGNPSRGI